MADASVDYCEADARLVERVRQGEADAFREIFTRYHALVFGLSRRLLNDPAEAEDICQEVFLVVHRRLPTLRDPHKLRPWLCRITLTRAYNAERSFRRRLRSLTVSIDQCAEASFECATGVGNPERALVSAQTRQRIDEALTALPFANRTVVILRDIEGLSYEEIAEAVEANLGTVKSRLARGREALRGRLHDLVVWHREVRP